MRTNRNKEILICAAILAAIEHHLRHDPSYTTDQFANLLKQNVTDAFTTDWNKTPIHQWTATLDERTAQMALPWRD